MRQIIYQICTAVGAIVLVYLIIILLVFLVIYLVWYFSDDRKNIDQEIFEGDNEEDLSELTIDRLVN